VTRCAAAAMAAALVLATLTGCGGQGSMRDRNVVIVAVRTPPNNLDPRQANDET